MRVIIERLGIHGGHIDHDRHAAADNRVRAEMPDGEIGDVHRAAATLAIAVFLAEQFSNHPVNMLFQRGFEQFFVLV